MAYAYRNDLEQSIIYLHPIHIFYDFFLIPVTWVFDNIKCHHTMIIAALSSIVCVALFIISQT